MKRWKKITLYLVGVIIILAAAGALIGYQLSAKISDERLSRMKKSPHFNDGGFVNLEPEAPPELTLSYLKSQFFGTEQREPPYDLPVIKLPPGYLNGKARAGLRVTWLGHSSTMVEIDGYRVLTDPVLSQRVSPFTFAGPKRFHPSPIALTDLKNIDAVVISHSHYDHLDEATIRHLAGQGTPIYLPLGTGSHLESWGISADLIREIDWWQDARLGKLKIVATPARHYSGRGLFDYKATFWASWSLIGPSHRVFFSGDTGYGKVFKEIGAKYGPFDLTLIKIGAYGPGDYWRDIHMPPDQSMKVHLDVKGKRMLPVHWATFNLALHDWDEPIKRALKDAQQAGVILITPKLGQTVDPGETQSFPKWWQKP